MTAKEPQYKNVAELVSHLESTSRMTRFARANDHESILEIAPKALDKFRADYNALTTFTPEQKQDQNDIEFLTSAIETLGSMGKEYTTLRVRARYTAFLLLRSDCDENKTFYELGLYYRNPTTKEQTDKLNATGVKMRACWHALPVLFLQIAIGKAKQSDYDRISKTADTIVDATLHKRTGVMAWFNKKHGLEVDNVPVSKDIKESVKIDGSESVSRLRKAYLKDNDTESLRASVKDHTNRKNAIKRAELIKEKTVPSTEKPLSALYSLHLTPEKPLKEQDLLSIITFCDMMTVKAQEQLTILRKAEKKARKAKKARKVKA